RALDAGCGRGAGVIANAQLQPDVAFTGMDLNRVAMAEARQEAARQGVGNIDFVEADLMSPDPAALPAEDFDVIYSSGVIHHLSDPLTGLRNLKNKLAPHGVMAIMVYAAHGREPLQRVQQAVQLLGVERGDFARGIALGRELTEDAAARGVFQSTPWESTWKCNDVEFVDRCLHVNETSYTVAAFFELLQQAGLRFVQWLEPADWSVARHLPEGPLRDQALRLPEPEQYRLLELIRWRPSLECLVSHMGNEPRRPLRPEQIPKASFRVNPEVSFSLETRNLKDAQRLESISYKIRAQETVTVTNRNLAKALMVLRAQTQPFTGDSWFSVMAEEDLAQSEAAALLLYLVENDIAYRPHSHDL
ncbi:MAG: class I SAM-dependent methyltransferase, partial [Candidatus Firestonebacteria bacterium]|nr:class I SAM-dependent methyltransferase [Candidatus Firestonebacteria bacterium]